MDAGKNNVEKQHRINFDLIYQSVVIELSRARTKESTNFHFNYCSMQKININIIRLFLFTYCVQYSQINEACIEKGKIQAARTNKCVEESNPKTSACFCSCQG